MEDDVMHRRIARYASAVVIAATSLTALTGTADAQEPVKTVYFAGLPGTNNDGNPDEWRVTDRVGLSQVVYNEWAPARRCDTSTVPPFVPDTATKLTGYSLGRLATIYYLARASDAQRNTISQVTMIDPGNYASMRNSCDSEPLFVGDDQPLGIGKRGADYLVDWLEANRGARLTILAGPWTATNSHQGIQEIYFNRLRDAERATGIEMSSRVLVCNYSTTETNITKSHHQMIKGADGYVDADLSTCPDGMPNLTLQEPKQGWHP
ncbi:hypothetical protein ACQEVB_11705 [Pseudonocardia sp. CA-107938]|uniref:hypothetical protein n=1 Tax=Pseudonocardia sp. CA-107938 TaxID=3240021 RepID=UPI003D8B71DF